MQFDPIVYEDFLPVSAAGIFQSNLGDEAAQEFVASPNQQRFEQDLGAKPFSTNSITMPASNRLRSPSAWQRFRMPKRRSKTEADDRRTAQGSAARHCSGTRACRDADGSDMAGYQTGARYDAGHRCRIRPAPAHHGEEVSAGASPIASENDLPLVPQSGNTGLVSGSTPDLLPARRSF